ncbi:UNVERIFIED_CONTAM: hypothetical protein Sindi_0057600, partial [Sesamum indicum]
GNKFAATVGTGNDATKIKTYTGPSLDKIDTLAGRIVDGGRPEHGGQCNQQTLYPDAITRACMRLDFARVCVMLDVCAFTKLSKPAKPPVSVYIPKTIPARPPSMHDQQRILPTQGVDNQREGRELPRGERLSRIPKTRPARSPPMHDQEGIPPTQGVDNQREGRAHDQERILPTQGEDNQREGREIPRETRLSREEKGKAIAVYNTFNAL